MDPCFRPGSALCLRQPTGSGGARRKPSDDGAFGRRFSFLKASRWNPVLLGRSKFGLIRQRGDASQCCHMVFSYLFSVCCESLSGSARLLDVYLPCKLALSMVMVDALLLSFVILAQYRLIGTLRWRKCASSQLMQIVPMAELLVEVRGVQ
jgi:hypothetical protein